MKAYRGVAVELHPFLTSALDGDVTASQSGPFNIRERTAVPVEQEDNSAPNSFRLNVMNRKESLSLA
jgi:hypothetical protein